MFERFTDRARRVVVLSQEEARSRDHNYIGTEHVLLGLIREGDGVGAAALKRMSVDFVEVRRRVDQIIGRGLTTPQGHVPFTPRAKRILEMALRESLALGQNYVGTEHLLLGLMREGEGVAAQVLGEFVQVDAVRANIVQLLKNDGGAHGVKAVPQPLLRYGTDLIAAADEGEFGPVHGRQREIRRVAQALTRHSRNNPVLVGDPGVGKSTIVTGLVFALARGEVAAVLRGKRIYRIDERFLTRQEEVAGALNALSADSDAILYVDEIAEVAGQGPLGPKLREAVVNRQFQVVSTATPEAFAALDPALLHVLQPVAVPEMSVEMAADVLRGLRDRLQDHHRLKITDEALLVVAESAHRYFRADRLPNSAIDLLDEVCAQAHPLPLANTVAYEARIADVRHRKEEAIAAYDFEAAARFRDEEKALLAERTAERTDSTQTPAVVTEITVAQVVADMRGELEADHRKPAVRARPLVDPFAESGADLWMIS
ncbi:Clp protease N-terminal domain-containing protein [Actinosynnema sp. NPDC023658]|uniref:Clp protease N-terminal domain-containing protein n=1 Tax=Actinosynnema sp. NPDC023658 TaxID=3155465 RepID=UPI0033C52598